MTDNADVVVNRHEPIPALGVPDRGGASSDGESKRDRLQKSLSGSRLAEKLQGAGAGFNDSSHSLQDRLFAKLVNRHHNVTFQGKGAL